MEEIALTWGLGYTKVRDALERLHTTQADWQEWRKYEGMHGTRLAVMHFQRVKSPADIPAAKPGNKSAATTRTSPYNAPNKFKGM